MKIFDKKAIAVVLTLSCVGTSYASEETIDKVKAHVYKEIDRTLTVGDALETRDMCKSTSWNFKVDSRKRKIVEYTCELTGYRDYLNQFSKENEKLEKLKTDYSRMLGLKEKAEMFLAFMDDMEKQNVFSSFADVKKKTPGINKMSLFVIGQTYEGAMEAGVPEKYINKFIKAIKIYNDPLKKDEGLAALVADPINSSMLDEMLNKGSYNHRLFLSYMEGVNKIRSREYETINTVKEEIDFIERKLAKEVANNKTPATEKLVQTIGFTIIKDTPIVVNCDFNYYNDAAAKAKPNAVEKIDSYAVCLKESYQSEYDTFYTDLFTKLKIK